ncbi:MAG: metallophosphoesterase [Sphingobacteriales bacterium]|nr:metallophosphoesterase [Sphingobacteriales bacterium]
MGPVLRTGSTKLKQCLQRSKFNYQKDRLIVLGDIVDRHDEAFECVEELLKIHNLIAIRGNHDDWFDEFCQTGRHPADWEYGGLATVQSYLGQGGGKRPFVPGGYSLTYILNPEDIPKKHRDFFSKIQPYFIDDDGRCFVHAGFNRFFRFMDQHPSTYYWDRELWAAAWEWQRSSRLYPHEPPFKIKTQFKEIYLGHTSTTNWNVTVPMQGVNVFNLDTGAGGRGKLTIMEVETKKFWQSDLVTKLYEMNFLRTN